MSHTLNLYRLQQIDTSLDRAQARMQAIAGELENDDDLRMANEQARSADAVQKAAKTKLDEAEAELENQRIKIEQIESSLYSGAVRNPKELQDLENDLGALKRHLTTLEDRLLDAMQESEESEASRLKAKVRLDAVQEKSKEQNRDLQEESEIIEKEINRLLTEKSAALGTLSQQSYDLYIELRKRHSGIAVSVISDGACGACGSTLTPALVQSARTGNEIAFCKSCGRILYGS